MGLCVAESLYVVSNQRNSFGTTLHVEYYEIEQNRMEIESESQKLLSVPRVVSSVFLKVF